MFTSTKHDCRLTVVSARLHSLPVLVGVPDEIGVSPCPPLHAARVEANSSLLIKLLKVLSVKRVLHSGLVWGLCAVQVVPVNTIEVGMALQSHASVTVRLVSYQDACLDMHLCIHIHTQLI